MSYDEFFLASVIWILMLYKEIRQITVFKTVNYFLFFRWRSTTWQQNSSCRIYIKMSTKFKQNKKQTLSQKLQKVSNNWGTSQYKCLCKYSTSKHRCSITYCPIFRRLWYDKAISHLQTFLWYAKTFFNMVENSMSQRRNAKLWTFRLVLHQLWTFNWRGWRFLSLIIFWWYVFSWIWYR